MIRSGSNCAGITSPCHGEQVRQAVVRLFLGPHDPIHAVEPPLTSVACKFASKARRRSGRERSRTPENSNRKFADSLPWRGMDSNFQYAIWSVIVSDSRRQHKTGSHLTPRWGRWIRTCSSGSEEPESVVGVLGQFSVPGSTAFAKLQCPRKRTFEQGAGSPWFRDHPIRLNRASEPLPSIP